MQTSIKVQLWGCLNFVSEAIDSGRLLLTDRLLGHVVRCPVWYSSSCLLQCMCVCGCLADYFCWFVFIEL